MDTFCLSTYPIYTIETIERYIYLSVIIVFAVSYQRALHWDDGIAAFFLSAVLFELIVGDTNENRQNNSDIYHTKLVCYRPVQYCQQGRSSGKYRSCYMYPQHRNQGSPNLSTMLVLTLAQF